MVFVQRDLIAAVILGQGIKRACCINGQSFKPGVVAQQCVLGRGDELQRGAVGKVGTRDAMIAFVADKDAAIRRNRQTFGVGLGFVHHRAVLIAQRDGMDDLHPRQRAKRVARQVGHDDPPAVTDRGKLFAIRAHLDTGQATEPGRVMLPRQLLMLRDRAICTRRKSSGGKAEGKKDL